MKLGTLDAVEEKIKVYTKYSLYTVRTRPAILNWLPRGRASRWRSVRICLLGNTCVPLEKMYRVVHRRNAAAGISWSTMNVTNEKQKPKANRYTFLLGRFLWARTNVGQWIRRFGVVTVLG